MSKKKPSGAGVSIGHSEKKQKEYERVARLQYGPTIVNESIQLWNSYGKERQTEILQEGQQVYVELAQALDAGLSPFSGEVQTLLQRWHDHLHYFYEPTLEILRGLGELYSTDPGFMKTFQKIHPGLADYMHEGINQYVDDLESAEIARMIAEDEQQNQRTQRLSQAKPL